MDKTGIKIENLADSILEYYGGIAPYLPLGEGVEYLNPYESARVREFVERFYRKYYSDTEKRTLIIGINPGRFGAGITGIPFTDPEKLEDICGIENEFEKRAELSADFVYKLIEAYGGPERFYGDFYITSVCPLGFVKNGKNFNYYDSAAVYEKLSPHLRKHIEWHFDHGMSSETVINWGKGKNRKAIEKLFERKPYKNIIHLPHPRWVMQYQRKSVDEWIEKTIIALGEAHQENLSKIN